MSEPRQADDRARLRTVIRDAADALVEWADLRRRLLRVPGVQVCVRVGDDVLVSAALGSADEERHVPLTTQHLFRVASHSKTFTATAIMQLREDGVLGLDDRLDRWLPELADHPLGTATLRELLGHQAGIVRDGDEADFWQLHADFPDDEALTVIARDHGEVMSSNAHFKYTNVGYSLLGRVVARASGEPYAQVVRRRILDPLELTRVHVDIDDVDGQECAAGHSGWFGRGAGERVHVVDSPSTGAMAAATGFVACAEDLSAYAAAHAFGDERLLTDASKRLMQRDESIITVDGRERSRYGLGFILDTLGDRRLVRHSGGFPGFITRTMVDPACGLSVCVLTNQTGGPATELATGIVRLIDLALREPASDVEVRRALPAGRALGLTVTQARQQGLDPASFTGRFVSAWGYRDVRLLGDRLVSIAPALAAPADDCQELRVLDADTLLAVPGDGYGAPGERWAVTRLRDGRASSIRAGGVTSVREDVFFEQM